MKRGKSQTKNRHWLPLFFQGVWFLCIAGCLTACYEPKEGCLDILSTNFSVDADLQCQDCCSWPELRVRFQHRAVYPDTIVNFTLRDSVYTDRDGNPYRVVDFRFLLSNFSLVRPDGSEISLFNKISTRRFLPDGSLKPDSILNDILLLRPGVSPLLDAGIFRAAGSFVSLRFDVGLSEIAQSVDPVSLPTTHPMNPASSGMEWDRMNGFDFQRVVLMPGASAQDTTQLRVPISSSSLRRRIELPVSLDIPEGRNLEFELQIDYRKWLSGIAIRNQTVEEIKQSLILQTPEVFSILSFRFPNN
jgi:hypothetical protein